MNVNAVLKGYNISEQYNPELCIYFKFDENTGKYIDLVGLDTTESKTISEEQNTFNSQVKELRGLSAIISSTAFSNMIMASVLYNQNKPEKTWDDNKNKLVKKYSDYLIQTLLDPIKALMIHQLETVEELIKVSEYRMKPIMLYNYGHGLKFYMVDDNQKYQFCFQKNRGR